MLEKKKKNEIEEKEAPLCGEIKKRRERVINSLPFPHDPPFLLATVAARHISPPGSRREGPELYATPLVHTLRGGE